MTERKSPSLVYCDVTHPRSDTPSREHILQQFAGENFAGVTIVAVKSSNLLSMLMKQHVLLPLLALLHPRALFVFAGSPPSPLFAMMPSRIIFYVQDTSLLTRPSEFPALTPALLAPQFALALRRVRHFLVPFEKTVADLKWYTRENACVRLYRPMIAARVESANSSRDRTAGPLKVVTSMPSKPHERIDMMIAVFQAMRSKFDRGAELHVVGATDAQQGEIAAHGGVVLHGDLRADGRRRVFESADFFVATSSDERDIWPLLEAQACGLAVIAPDRPTFREALGAAGAFFDPILPQQAVGMIEAIVTTSGWRLQHAEAALQNVRRWNDLALHDRTEVSALFADVGARPDPATAKPAGP